MSIYRMTLNETDRMEYTATHFGSNFPFQIEPYIYNQAQNMSQDYQGGYWQMYELDNGGFYMVPDADEPFQIECSNDYQGTVSADAFGIIVCLYAYSHLSFRERLSETCAEQYHLLREYMFEHPEVQKIMAAID